MNKQNFSLSDFSSMINRYSEKKFQFVPNSFSNFDEGLPLYKKGGEIKIKKKNVGSFTRYCGGNVTSECIRKGKNSPDPKIRKKATFAANARKWKHKNGGVFKNCNVDKLNKLIEGLKNHV